MNINRNNCEAFFLDYYEGTLTEAQVAEMFTFLKANPDQREIFESFADISVSESGIENPESRVPDFSFLKKEPVADIHEQAQQWMVEHVDGTISDEDTIALENYLNENPSKRADLAAFEKTILRADENENIGDLSAFRKETAITPENFEYYAIALIEGTISENAKSLLESFVLTHPEFSVQLDAFRASVQKADESIVFDAKSSLKKSSVVVTKDNIEELLVGKTERQLSAHDERAVDAFLAVNPEYKRDLDLLLKTKLVADVSEIFEAKDKLKRGVILINESNFEQYLISASEGLLNSEELKAFNAFVATKKKYGKAVALYAATKLQPDLTVVYDDKEGLKRKERGSVIWFSASMRYAAAAVLVILLSVYFWVKFDNANPNEVEVAHKQDVINNNDNEVVPSNNNGQIRPDNNIAANTNDNNLSKGVSVNNANTDTVPVEVPNQVHPSSDGNILVTSFTPVTIIANALPNEARESVTFSDALYAVVYNDNNNPALIVEPADEYITPGQLAMRWMKTKIDGNDPVLAQQQNDMPDVVHNPTPRDKNVDGMDLTESAIDRVGQSAANGNIAMDQRNDGTYLQLWNYEVRVAK